ncbi:hypothetical protein DFH11DRAFT_1744557 [Phellopilus nigrolimitatus]|nr:hypothetical protein DFH11DRAFT_1744557 [Phellopilus nigrolimitatus]
MGGKTGYIIFPVDGTYLVWYCHLNALNIAEFVLASIPSEEKEFNEWRDLCKTILRSSNVEHRIAELLPQVDVDDFKCSYDDTFYFRKISPAHTPRGLIIHDYHWFYRHDDVTRIYTIDLDRMAFSVDDEVHFKLDRIPRGYDNLSSEYFTRLDSRKKKYLWPKVISDVGADLYPDIPVSVAGLSKYQELLSSGKVKSIESSVWMKSPYPLSATTQELTKQVGKMLIKQFLSTLQNAHRYAPTDKAFEISAEYLLRALTPCSFRLWFDEVPDYVWVWEQGGYEKIKKEHQRFMKMSFEERMREMLPKYEARRKEKEEKAKRSPTAFFWFRSCLIVLSSRLVSEDHLHARIGDVVLHVQGKQLEKCTALLWSITARPSHTAMSFPFLMRMLMTMTGSNLVFDFWRTTYGLPVSIPPRIIQAHLALRVLQTFQPGSARPPIPLDVQLLIMGFTDLYTYDMFGRTSRALRREWVRRPRISSLFLTRCMSVPFEDDIWNPDTAEYEDSKVCFTAHEVYTGYMTTLDLNYTSRYCICEDDLYNEEEMDDRMEGCGAHPIDEGIPIVAKLRNPASGIFHSKWGISDLRDSIYASVYP